jgi:hypothetical protein
MTEKRGLGYLRCSAESDGHKLVTVIHDWRCKLCRCPWMPAQGSTSDRARHGPVGRNEDGETAPSECLSSGQRIDDMSAGRALSRSSLMLGQDFDPNLCVTYPTGG